MYTDRENMASIAQAVTVTAVSTDSILVGATRNLGRGRQPRAFAQVVTTATAAGAATVNVELIQADNGALTTNVEVLAQSGPVAVASLTAGNRVLDVVIPTTKRAYIGFRYTVATGPLTAGAFTAGFVSDTETPIPERNLGFTGLT